MIFRFLFDKWMVNAVSLGCMPSFIAYLWIGCERYLPTQDRFFSIRYDRKLFGLYTYCIRSSQVLDPLLLWAISWSLHRQIGPNCHLSFCHIDSWSMTVNEADRDCQCDAVYWAVWFPGLRPRVHIVPISHRCAWINPNVLCNMRHVCETPLWFWFFKQICVSPP